MENIADAVSVLLRALAGAASVCSIGLASDPARADDLPATLVASKVTLNADGKEVLVFAEECKPGEVLEYAATYKNESKNAIFNLKPLLPIPDGTAYVAKSGKPAPAEASLDGKKFEPVPLRRKIKLPDGSEREEKVPASEYRALRWNIGELEAGAETMVAARVRLLSNSPR